MAPSSPQTPRLCVVAPFYNEQEGAELFYEALCQQLEELEGFEFRFVFVDDGSTDETLGALSRLAERDSRVHVLSLSRNFGHQIALTAGLDHAAGDVVLMMDSDLQHPPQLIPELVAAWQCLIQNIRVSIDWSGRSASAMRESISIAWMAARCSCSFS